MNKMTEAQKFQALLDKANQAQDIFHWQWPSWHVKHDDCTYMAQPYTRMMILLNPDFARALFGEGPYYKLNDPKRTVRQIWQHELQQAVLLPTVSEQINYMYKAAFGED